MPERREKRFSIKDETKMDSRLLVSHLIMNDTRPILHVEKKNKMLPSLFVKQSLGIVLQRHLLLGLDFLNTIHEIFMRHLNSSSTKSQHTT
jgi:hypothetical protein